MNFLFSKFRKSDSNETLKQDGNCVDHQKRLIQILRTVPAYNHNIWENTLEVHKRNETFYYPLSPLLQKDFQTMLASCNLQNITQNIQIDAYSISLIQREMD